MKCPKCHYIGYETAERCRNCGYALDGVGDASENPGPATDAAANVELDEPTGDLLLDVSEDLDLVFQRRRTTPAGLTTPDRKALDELQLFPDGPAPRRRAHPTPDPAPLPAPRAPLSVRRATPEPARSPMWSPRLPDPGAAENSEAATASVAPAPGDPDIPENDDPLGEEAAGAASRLAAVLIDAAIAVTVDTVVLYFTLRLCGLTFSQVDQLPIWPLLGFFGLLNGGYITAFLTASGQTLGKMAMGIRVISRDGSPVPIGHAVLRTVGYLVSAAPVGLGFVLCLFGRERLALHDRLADTRVVTDLPPVSLQPPAVSIP